MWVRGLKPYNVERLSFVFIVAPYVGAWIETELNRSTSCHSQSHPMWVRGLKQPTEKIYVFRTMSHPMWVRGLKHVVVT